MSDYEQALTLAKQGKLEQAQALLVTIDHPKADALLERVNKALAARGGAVTSRAIAEGIKQMNYAGHNAAQKF